MPTNDRDADRLRADFLRFRERGDVAALARVFDALGPRLLLLAAHLCRGADRAEDLVQSTFLDAMRSARGFERERDLEAWLAGILRNRAVDAARRRERRREVEGESLDVVADPQPGPVDEALSAERVEILRNAIAGLPATYREVAVLRVVHGLEPIEIARALGRPAGTVRMQCHRAVEQLRRTLPAGWVGALVVPVRPWSDVRSAVLGAGQEIAATAAVAGVAWSGVLMMTGKKWAMVLVAAALALGALWVGSGWRPGDAESGAAPRGSARTAISESRDAESEVLAAEEVAVEAPGHRRPLESPVGGVAELPGVVGRCVDPDGMPIEGVPVRVVAWPELGGHSVDTDGPRRITSDEDGRFEWRGSLPAGSHRLALSFEDDRFCWCKSDVWLGVEEPFQDLGEVVLPRGVRIRGRVADEAGRPVAGVIVRATAWTMHDPELVVQPWRADSAETDEDGRFGPMQRLAPSGGSAWMQVEGRQLIGSTEVIWDGVREEQSVDLVLATPPERPSVEGLVVDASGDPIPWARVTVRAASYQSASCDHAGRFEVEGDEESSGAVALRVERDGYRSAVVEAEWGARGLRVALEAVPGLQLRVVEARSGIPVERYGIAILYDQLRGTPGGRRCFGQIGEHPIAERPDGLLALDGLRDGELALRIEPGSDSLAPSGFVTIPAIPDRPAELVVELERLTTQRVRIVDREGEPCSDVEVECIDSLGAPLQLAGEAFTWADWGMLSGGFHKALCFDRARTDPRGEAEIRCDARRFMHLRLRGGGVALQIHGPFEFGGDDVLRLTATPEAIWRARILPPGLAGDLARMSAHVEGEQPDPRERGVELVSLMDESTRLRRFFEPLVPYDDEGHIEMRGLPAGRYRVELVAGGNKIDAGRIELRAGEVCGSDLDLAAIWPTRVELELLVDGNPAAHRPVVNYVSRVKLAHEQRDDLEAVNQAFLRTDAAGRLSFWSFPGSLEIDLRMPGGKLWVGPIDVPPAAVLRETVAIRNASLLLQLEQADGEPAGHWPLQVGNGYWSRTDNTLETDGAGMLHLEGISAGSYRVFALPKQLVDREAREAFRSSQGATALQRAWLEVGEIEVVGSVEPARVRMILPDR